MTAQLASHRHWPLNRLPLLTGAPELGADIVTDMSPLPRFGLRGSGTAAWLKAQGVPLPDMVNQVAEGDGLLIARLGRDEALMLPASPSDGAALKALRDAWEAAEGVKGYDAYRDEGWCWLRLTGPGTRDALRLLTAVDTRERAFPVGGVLQTRAMHLDAVLLRGSDDTQVDMFFDVASSDYVAAFLADVLPGHRLVRAAE
ncbi:hypothetical protein [Chelativorans xinjiangense]|uniref:hypothetical protein n=1 Tax=Chelativorans xinjiangense TaxID=2681485 RepID=UPI00135A912C|nr:hypothetical protein [Chelativorans xinjiangense]